MNKLREKRNALLDKMDNLIKSAKDETRAFTSEETAEYDKCKAEIQAIDETIKKEDEIRSLEIGKNKNKPDNDKAKSEERAFEAYIRGVVNGEERAENNITYGANGAVIPTTIMNKIVDKVVEICPIFQMATKYNATGNITIPYVDTADGDITVAFSKEFSTLTASKIKFSSIELKGYLAAALCLVSKQLINNSQFDILSYVIDYISKKVSKFIENFCINGDTINAGANSGLANSVTQSVTLASASKISADDLIDTQETLVDAYQSGACWIMNRETRAAIRKLKDNDGQYMLNKDLTSQWGYTLLGKPVYTTDAVNALSDGGTIAYYGDFSGLAVKLGETAETQILLEKYAEQHAVGINVWFELDATVENPEKIVKLDVPVGG